MPEGLRIPSDQSVSFTPGFSQVYCVNLDLETVLNGFPSSRLPDHPAEAGCE